MIEKLKQNKIITGVIISVLLVGIGLLSFVATGPNDPRSRADETPEENSFYSAVRDGDPVLFYRYKGLMIDYNHADPFTGFLIEYEQPFDAMHDHKNYGDFRQLDNPRKIFTFPGVARVDNLKLSEDKGFLAMSVLGGEKDSTNYLYEVNLTKNSSRTIIERDLSGGTGQFQGGTMYVLEYIPDEYIVYALIKGTPPPDQPPISVVVRNIQTSDEKVLGSVGDIKLDTSAGTVSFKPYGKIQEPCTKPKDDDCFPTDTFKIADKPVGQPQTQPLP